MTTLKVSILRFNPEQDTRVSLQAFEITPAQCKGGMLLDALVSLKGQDDSLSFRRSCGEGVCGSCAMNINGKNGLACTTPLNRFIGKSVVLRPLPGMPIIRDLVVDLTQFYKQYERVNPFLQNTKEPLVTECLQSPTERAKLDGLYECILCACCTSGCPSSWWQPETFLGPAASLQAARFIFDSRDDAQASRLAQLEDNEALFRCRNIMNCVNVCPKNLNPTKAIGDLRRDLLNKGS